MADTVHDDRLAEVFTRFRSEVREEIRPPGTHAARQAARHRRTVRVACAAMVVVFVGAVVGIVTTVGNRDANPALTAAQMKELIAQADSALDKGPFGGRAVAVTAQTQGETISISHFGSSPGQFVKGDDYYLFMRCFGRGTVAVAWEAPGGPSGTAQVVCGGSILQVQLIPQANGASILVRLTPDAQAIGRAAIAVGYLG